MEKIVREYGQVLLGNVLFAGLDEEELVKALKFYKAERVSYRKRERIHAILAPLSRFGFVLNGAACAYQDDLKGKRVIVAKVQPGNTFGEAVCYLHTENSPVGVVASEDTELLWLSVNRLMFPVADALELNLKNRFIRLLAEHTLSLNQRVRVLERLTLREKLMAYFTEMSNGGCRFFTVPMNRDEMAAYTGANRSALSRELSNMKKEGLIDYHKNMFRIV